MSLIHAKGALPAGCAVRWLTSHEDSRGRLVEVFRPSWDTGCTPSQWNVVDSAANTLRGVHVHIEHDDYLFLLRGRMSVGLADLRRDSPTHGLATIVDLVPGPGTTLTIAHGVAHGFHFEEPALYTYGLSSEWTPLDELGCHWTEAGLGIPWKVSSPLLSERDAAAGSLGDLLEELERQRPGRFARPLGR